MPAAERRAAAARHADSWGPSYPPSPYTSRNHSPPSTPLHPPRSPLHLRPPSRSRLLPHSRLLHLPPSLSFIRQPASPTHRHSCLLPHSHPQSASPPPLPLLRPTLLDLLPARTFLPCFSPCTPPSPNACLPPSRCISDALEPEPTSRACATVRRHSGMARRESRNVCDYCIPSFAARAGPVAKVRAAADVVRNAGASARA